MRWLQAANCFYLYAVYTIGSAFYHLKNHLLPLYDEREAAAIAHTLMEHITGMDKLQRLAHKQEALTATATAMYEQALLQAQQGVPVQYIIGKAWFAGNEFIVNEHVLIPRPETEELVQWIINGHKLRADGLRILDVGTGSGCIPVFLKIQLPHAAVFSCDISNDALNVARQNAHALNADVHLLQLDFLDEAQHEPLGVFDIIVSNPPYIPMAEKERLHTNVRDHEPMLALFVPNDDALVFYRAIAMFGLKHLANNGSIYCELDADHAAETKELFEEVGYSHVQLRKDMHGNNRMLMARKAF